MATVIALPALSALLLLTLGKRSNKFGPGLAIAASTGSFLIGLWQFLQMVARPEEERAVITTVYEWLAVPAAGFKVNFALQLDQLSISFVLLITFVGTLIHIYSLGYMSHDENKRKFFAYLNLFVAAMLLLVLADNYLLLYVGWEGVGLASYLLIGFWQHKPTAAVAAKKAFVANRVGDFGLSLAIMTMFIVFGSVSFSDVNQGISGAPAWVSLTLGLLLLLAACGKSAQFPLQSWLLDAMEGPTPVSALIHAATMVTAGVYLIVRSASIFNASEIAQTAVVIIGAISLLMGAIIGAAKDDIKKSLAGSTMSQIGYMVLAAGLGPIGYVFAILHLVTHGFFKAVMFLGAGSVMHATNDNVDMRRYGGLSKVMIFTTITFFIGYLAIIGIPPFAGFYSKDHIIEAALSHSWWAGAAVLFGAGLTAFYMTRMVVMTFVSKPRWEDDVHPHESPLSMTLPMIVLSIGAASLGIILTNDHMFEHWLEPVTGFVEPEPPFSIQTITIITLSVVAVGVLAAIWQYRRIARVAPKKVSLVVAAARKDLYGDVMNEALLMRPGQGLTRLLNIFDKSVVDGFVNGIGSFTGGVSARLRRSETGYVRSYAMSIVLGTAILVVALLIVGL
ncbi:MAG: NADH-quinone oxidoreductase subunit L [Actinobacteria bacterium]|nr:NADH-quinone oxidoreductase subunit L [Actinomycetota bacterium]